MSISSIDEKKPTIDEKKPTIDEKKPTIDEKKPTIDEKKPKKPSTKISKVDNKKQQESSVKIVKILPRAQKKDSSSEKDKIKIDILSTIEDITKMMKDGVISIGQARPMNDKLLNALEYVDSM